jgi:type IV secretory pathway ATPase VirB11/archaellum biosynthesis ATPase
MRTVREGLREVLPGDDRDETGCGCRARFEGETLVVDADGCDDGGRLTGSPACRAAVVSALTDRDAERVRVLTDGIERTHDGRGVALLVAAGRFVELCAGYDERLAERARRDPLAAASEATGRADRVSEIAAETGLSEVSAGVDGYESALAPVAGLALSAWRVETDLPPEARLREVRELETGATVRRYESDRGQGRYVLEPAELSLDRSRTRLLERAYDHLATGGVECGERAPRRALDRVSSEGTPIEQLVGILRKHTRGAGLLEDLFADERVTDAFVTAPAGSNPVRVGIGDRRLPTNVRLTERALRGLSARFRRESGRGFSRAEPTLDAATEIAGRRIRVAGVRRPASDGTAFAFRAHDRATWTLPALIANETLTPGAAALLSLAVERGRSLLIAGPRGAGKTTLLAALLWEIPPAVRTLCIEDTPELPVGPLQASGRDVQSLRVGEDGTTLSATDALRTGLRLGNGALVVGEVRGEEARVLYEAMRVGANSEAVLGTVHGDGAGAVYERVVSDLGVEPSAFGATDAVVTVERTDAGVRRLRSIEEVHADPDGSTFESLYDRPEGRLEPTGRIERGQSRLVESLTPPDGSYADVRDALAERSERLATLAATDRTDGEAVTAATLERQS